MDIENYNEFQSESKFDPLTVQEAPFYIGKKVRWRDPVFSKISELPKTGILLSVLPVNIHKKTDARFSVKLSDSAMTLNVAEVSLVEEM